MTGEAKPGKAKNVRSFAEREYRVWVVHGAGGPEETKTVRGLRAALEAISGSWDAEITDVETGEVIET